jgi:hypothetical protein
MRSMDFPEVRATEKIVPDAYHGTRQQWAAFIIRDGFKLSRGKDLFLGDGVYFFETSHQTAKAFAIRRHRTDIAVIKAVINLGRCFDLHVQDYSEFVSECAEKMRKRAGRRKEEITDALVINFIASIGEIDSVKASRRTSGDRLFYESKWFHNQEIMICVRNLANILNVELV